MRECGVSGFGGFVVLILFASVCVGVEFWYFGGF